MTASRPPRTGDAVVDFFLSQDGLLDRLLAEHIDRGDGRCKTCGGSSQSGRDHYPCPIRVNANRASDVRDEHRSTVWRREAQAVVDAQGRADTTRRRQESARRAWARRREQVGRTTAEHPPTLCGERPPAEAVTSDNGPEVTASCGS